MARSLNRIYYGLLQRMQRFRFSMQKNNVCFFMFHEIYTGKTDAQKLNLSKEHFVDFLDRLQKTNVQFASIDQALENDNEKKCVFTFDDVYGSVILNAVPILKERGIPYALFVSPAFLGKAEYITAEQIKSLSQDPLCTICFHSKSHKYMRKLSEAEVKDEIDCSAFENEYGVKCDYFAYPFGSFYTVSKKNIEVLKKSGYRAAFSTVASLTNAGMISKNRFFIPRVNISDHSYKKVLTNNKSFFADQNAKAEQNGMRIIASTSLLSPYRASWFKELAKYAEVSVYYLYDRDKDRDDQWFSDLTGANIRFIPMKGSTWHKLGKISFDFIKEIKRKSYDIIILDGYSYFTQLMNIRFLNKRKMKYFVNIDGRVELDPGMSLKQRLKQKMILGVPFFLCGSLSGKQYLMNCGVSEDRIFNHVFTSLYETDIYDTVADPAEKKMLREKLGMVEKHVVVTVGRFTYLNGYGKGYDAVMRAAERSDRGIGWYIIGGEPTAEFAAMKEKAGLDNVHFVDFKSQEELKEYYRAADLSVLMTVGDVWGLVINEAMACGLPVITTDRCVAGRELIENGKNGFIIPVGDDEALAKHIGEIIGDAGTLEAMGKASLARIRGCTIENMAKTHIEIFRQQGEE